MRAVALGFLYATGIVYFALLFGWSWPLLAIVFFGVRWRKPALSFSPIDVFTVLVVVAYAFYALRTPPTHWDFWAIWGLKGRVFYESRAIDWHFLTSRWNAFAHPDYPLLLPLNYSAFALVTGAWNDRWIGALFVGFAIALLLIVRDEAAQDVKRHAAAAIALTTTAFAFAPQIGLAEGPMIAYGGAALLMIRRGSLTHGAILLGLAGSTKNEGLTLIIAVVLALLIAREPLTRIARLWPALVIVAPWLVLRAVHHLPTDLTAPGMMARLTARLVALPQLAEAMARALWQPWLWLLLIVSLFIAWKEARREKFLLLAVLFQLMFFIGAYLITPLDAAWHVASSFGRISTQLGVPLMYAAMVSLARSFE